MPLTPNYKTYDQLDSQKPKKAEDQLRMSKVVAIGSGGHKQALVMHHPIVVVDIWASWCGPCMQVAPKFSALADTYSVPDKCVFASEDIDKGWSPEVTGVPCFEFYMGGKLVDQMMGANIDNVQGKVEQLLQQLA